MSINEDDWELINDDGFVYKRLKRHNQTPTFSQPPPPDPLEQAQAQRKRKKTILLSLKNKYQKEINQWEHLSNTLTALQNKPPVTVPLMVQNQSGVGSPESSSDNGFRELADKVLAQLEAQEATINEVSRLCDTVEALCDAEEQRLKVPLFDLPIWDPSCEELMTSLQTEE